MSRTDTVALRLLSLDGGGIRGLSTLLILETMMHRIQAEQNLDHSPRPCDYFDLIGGTSTGGIIALMLGRLRMSVKEAIDCYDNLTSTVFSELKVGPHDGKYKATTLEKIVKVIVKERTGDSETQLLDDGALGGICKTFVCAMNAHNMNGRTPIIFRTYVSPKETPIPCTMWQAARATSATPRFFKRIFIGPSTRPEPFIDGGLGRNNPTEEILNEARLMFPDRNVACVVSIGAGKLRTIDVPKQSFFQWNVVPVGLIKAMTAMACDCEETAQQMERKFENWPEVYFRFNVEQGLQHLKLRDWQRMSEVAAHTRSYMRTHEVDQRLDVAVKAIWERQGELNTLTLNSIPPSIRTYADIDISPSCIPDKPQHVFGRDQERAEIVQALLKFESVMISGSGGVGKTTLALAALHDQRVIECFQPQIYFIDCSTITTLDGLYGQLAVDLHIMIPKDRRKRGLQALLQTFRQQAATIVCLDNFETLWDGSNARSDIQAMLSRLCAIPTLALLLTMCSPDCPPDVLWSKASPHDLQCLSEEASTDIFAEQSKLHEVDEYAKRLIKAAGGMPLILTLLARLAQFETPKATWNRWTANGTSSIDMTMNLDTSIELSLSRLHLDDRVSTRRTLGILARLPGGLRKASEIITNLQPAFPDDADLPLALSRLVTAGLAYIDSTTNGPRYRVLSPIKDYAIKRQMMGASLQSRVINYYVAFILDRSVDAAKDAAFEERSSLLYAVVPLELANVRSILGLALEQAPRGFPFKPFHHRHIHALLAHMQWELFLETPSLELVQTALFDLSLPPALRGDCFSALSDVQQYWERLNEAEQSLDRAWKLYQRAHSVPGEAKVRQALGNLYLRQNRLAEAETSLNLAVKLHQQAHDALGEANDHQSLRDIYVRQHRHADAERSGMRVAELHQQAYGVVGEANDHLDSSRVLSSPQDHRLSLARMDQSSRHQQAHGTGVVIEANDHPDRSKVLSSHQDQRPALAHIDPSSTPTTRRYPQAHNHVVKAKDHRDRSRPFGSMFATRDLWEQNIR